MPEPEEGEGREEWMSRCMSDPEQMQTTPDEAEREAVCSSKWEAAQEDAPPEEGAAEVLLYEQIGSDPFYGGGTSAKAFREGLRALKGRAINLRINSPGGNVFEAAAILKALDDHPGEITVDVDGLAASAASVVMMAGHRGRIRIASNAMVMIHNPQALTVGDSADHRQTADLLDKVREQLIDTYRRKVKLPRARVGKLMDAETWFTGAEAVEIGLADEATAPVRVAALAQHAALIARYGYRHPPRLPEDSAAWAETRRRAGIAARL